MAVLELVITGLAGSRDSTRISEPVPPLFVAEIVILIFPETAGVPEMRPVLGFILRPVGRPVAAKLVGFRLAVI